MFDQYLIGMIYIGPDATNTDFNVWQFGGKTEKLKHALMEAALALIAKEYNDMYNVRILNEISKYVNNSNVIMLKSKYKHEILINPEPYNKTNVVNNLKNLFDKEIKIRNQYDKYDEIITIILEQATSKFDDYV
jgi:phosphotransferase system HPr-like phosphotransfer protein